MVPVRSYDLGKNVFELKIQAKQLMQAVLREAFEDNSLAKDAESAEKKRLKTLRALRTLREIFYADGVEGNS